MLQDSRENLYGATGESNGEDSEPQSELELESYLTDMTKGNATSEFECFYSEEEFTDEVKENILSYNSILIIVLL